MTLLKNILEFISWLWFRSQGLITKFLFSQLIFFCLESFIMEYYGINIIQKYANLDITITGLQNLWFTYFVFNSLLIRIAEKTGQPLTRVVYKTINKWTTSTYKTVKKWLLSL